MILKLSLLSIATRSSFSLSLFSTSLSFIFVAMEAVAVVGRWHLSRFVFISLLENQPKSFNGAFSRESKPITWYKWSIVILIQVIATTNCNHKLQIYRVFDRYFYLRWVAISKKHLQPYSRHCFRALSHWSRVLSFFETSICSHPFYQS